MTVTFLKQYVKKRKMEMGREMSTVQGMIKSDSRRK